MCNCLLALVHREGFEPITVLVLSQAPPANWATGANMVLPGGFDRFNWRDRSAFLLPPRKGKGDENSIVGGRVPSVVLPSNFRPPRYEGGALPSEL
jgi:hypothetical protein